MGLRRWLPVGCENDLDLQVNWRCRRCLMALYVGLACAVGTGGFAKPYMDNDIPVLAKGPKGALRPVENEAAKVLRVFWRGLAEADWRSVLATCSDRVREESANHPSARAFIESAIPVDGVVASRRPRIGSFVDRPSVVAYIFDVPVWETGNGMPFYWEWRLEGPKGGKSWRVDFDPVQLDGWLESKRAQARDLAREQARIEEDLTHDLQGLELVLSPSKVVFEVGEPILLSLTLTNSGASSVYIDDQQAAVNGSLTVIGPTGEEILYRGGPVQTAGSRIELPPGATRSVFVGLDVSKQYEIGATGAYRLQFSGRGLDIFARSQDQGEEDLEEYPRPFPSNVVRIEVLEPAPVKFQDQSGPDAREGEAGRDGTR